MFFEIKNKVNERLFHDGSFFKISTSKTVKWLRSGQGPVDQFVRFVSTTALAVLLSVSIIGIPLVYLGIKEWKRQNQESKQLAEVNKIARQAVDKQPSEIEQEQDFSKKPKPIPAPTAEELTGLKNENEPEKNESNHLGEQLINPAKTYPSDQESPKEFDRQKMNAFLKQQLDEALLCIQNERKKKSPDFDPIESNFLYKIARGYELFDKEKAKSIYLDELYYSKIRTPSNDIKGNIIFRLSLIDEEKSLKMICDLEENKKLDAFFILERCVLFNYERNLKLLQACKEKFNLLNVTHTNYSFLRKLQFAHLMINFDFDFFINSLNEYYLNSKEKTEDKFSNIINSIYNSIKEMRIKKEEKEKYKTVLDKYIFELLEIKKSKNEESVKEKLIDDFIFKIKLFQFLYLEEQDQQKRLIDNLIDEPFIKNSDEALIRFSFGDLNRFHLNKKIEILEKSNIASSNIGFSIHIEKMCSEIETIDDFILIEPVLEKLEPSLKIKNYLIMLTKLIDCDMNYLKNKLANVVCLIDQFSENTLQQIKDKNENEKQTIIKSKIIGTQKQLIKLYKQYNMHAEAEQLMNRWQKYRKDLFEEKNELMIAIERSYVDSKTKEEIVEAIKRLEQKSYSPIDAATAKKRVLEILKTIPTTQKNNALNFIFEKFKKQDIEFALDCLNKIEDEYTKIFLGHLKIFKKYKSILKKPH